MIIAGYSRTAVSPLLLDSISASASTAVSTRKLRNAYAGAALKGRNDGNTVADVGFTANDLDQASAVASAGAGALRVETWYDQSGNANDMQFVTDMGKVVIGGAVVTLGSNPTVQTAGGATQDGYRTVGNITTVLTAAAWSAVCIVQLEDWSDNSTPTYGQACIFQDFNGTAGCAIGTSGQAFIRSNQYDGAFKATGGITATINTPYVILVRYDGTTLKTYVNGGTNDTGTIGNISAFSGGGMLLARNAAAAGDDVNTKSKFSEAIFFKTLLSVSDANILGNSMATRCGATWANIS